MRFTFIAYTGANSGLPISNYVGKIVHCETKMIRDKCTIVRIFPRDDWDDVQANADYVDAQFRKMSPSDTYKVKLWGEDGETHTMNLSADQIKAVRCVLAGKGF
jgi:hypothetical protein